MLPTALLRSFCPVPVTHQNLISLLQAYRRPNDTIQAWMKKGYLVPLGKGIYAISDAICGSRPSPVLVSNVLYGPSYVSLEYALSWYEAIPEHVAEVSAVTTRRSKSLTNALGRFSYTHLSVPYYSLGIQMVQLGPKEGGLMATPEKALLDMVVCTRGLLFRSKKDASHWLQDMRLDEHWLATLRLDDMASWAISAPKASTVHHLIQTIRAYVA